jgi:uncharacterized damage-inducible protein DinB
MSPEYSHTDEFRSASFTVADLAGSTFRDCNLSDVSIASSYVEGMRISGFDGRAGTVFVDDVDVSAYVHAELDRRYPERLQTREMHTADDLRATWDRIETLWLDTIAHAERLPEDARHERVRGEWSFVETLRHLVFAVDVWVGRMVGDEPMPYHRLGLPPTDYPSEAAAGALGVELSARPAYAEVVAAHADRREQLRAVLGTITDSQLEQMRTAAPAPPWEVESHSVRHCLTVVINEHCEHRRFAERDLAMLQAR